MGSLAGTGFAMPTVLKITGRTSTMTHAFVNAIIPVIEPDKAAVSEALHILGLDPTNLRCIYCGDRSTEWDHLRPLVQNKQPTGYVSEIANLVPACGKCNQSKGSQHWKTWITSSARLSPSARGVPDLASRIERLDEYERRYQPRKINFEAEVSPELWATYWANHQRLLELMKEYQKVADEVKSAVLGKIKR